MIILGIETSCDETGICLIKTDESAITHKIEILGNQLYSQIAKHKEFGGVLPMLAKREHAKNLVPLLEKCLLEANSLIKKDKNQLNHEKEESIKIILEREKELYDDLVKFLREIEKPNIHAIAVTNGPGLEPALWVGITFAKALSEAWKIPIIATNHMEGHIVVATLKSDKLNPKSYILEPITHPSLALLISGGHTQLVLIKEKLQYKIIGNTCDDALGEAYDKVARMLGLTYPGGKIISDLAQKEREENPNKKPPYVLPRPMIHSKDLNFSFSGLKTAVLYTIKKIPKITDQVKQEISLEFENAILDVLIHKTSQSIEKYLPKTLIIGGGVSANITIRKELQKICQKYNLNYLVPEADTSTDNALMIALAGYLNILAGKETTNDFKAEGNLRL